MATDTRPPTTEEAVAWIRKSLTDEYKRACMKYWRDKGWNDMVDQVERRLEELKK